MAEANGRSSSVGWEVVCMHKWTGGLGLPNLRWFNIALQARWLWLKHVDGVRPWKEFDMKVPPKSLAIYKSALFVHVGNNGSISLDFAAFNLGWLTLLRGTLSRWVSSLYPLISMISPMPFWVL